MFVGSIDAALPMRVLGPAAVVGALAAASGVAGLVPPAAAAGLAVAVTAVPAAALLIRLALAIRSVRGPGNACRGAGLLGLGVLTSGITMIMLSLIGAGRQLVVATGGTVVAASLSLLGLLLLPGVATNLVTRVRRAFDGLGLAVSFALVGWLLLPAAGNAHPLAYLVVLVAVIFGAITTMTVLRAIRQRPSAVRCGTGAGLTVLGLTLVTVVVGADAPAWALPLMCLPTVAGPVVTWTGARRVDPDSGFVRSADAHGTFAGYPVLAVPVGAVVLATGYHLIVIGVPDRTAVTLGMAVALVLMAREVLGAADVRRYARRLVGQEAHLRALVAGAMDLTLVIDDNLVVRWQSPAGERQFGLRDQELLGRRFTELVHPDDAATTADKLRAAQAPGAGGDPDGPILIEARVADGDGRWRETESTVSDLRSVPEVGALVVNIRDVGERRHLERTVHRLTSTDGLTGLPNRRELVRTVAVRRAGGYRPGTFVVIDLHGVTRLTERHGGEAGDTVVIEAARRLRTSAGADDLVGRLTGRRFAAVTAQGPIEAYALGVRLLAELTLPYQLSGGPARVDASVGLASLHAADSAEAVVRHGDLAVRRAARLGRNRIEWYDESLEEQLVRRIDLERFLPGAAGRGELDLVYQPVVELTSSRPVGVEALLRWRHAALGTVPPCELFPIADKLRVSGEIGHWVLHTACRQTAAWRRDGYDLWLAVNASGPQLAADDFVPGVAAALSVHQTPPERLTVEVAEEEIGDDVRAVADQLGRLRALGVRTALDRFGAGHMSLAQLRRLPLDFVKIGGQAATTVSSVDGGPAGVAPLAVAVVDVARRLGLEVVAENLETQAQLDLVRGAGCRYGQGHLMAPPAPVERIEAYLDLHHRPES